MTGDVKRLPKWAQAKIADLERDIVLLKGKIEDRDSFIAKDYGGSNVKIWGGMDRRSDWDLPIDCAVDFYPRGYTGSRYQGGINVSPRHEKTGKLRIASNSGAIYVEPIATNCYYTWTDR